MAEKIYTHPRHEQKHPQAELHNHEVEKLNELIEKGRHSRHEHAEKLDEIRAETHEHAQGAAELISQQTEQAQPAPVSPLINRDLKDLKFQRTLQSVRKDLSAPERALSRVVHNPVIDAVSSVAEKTVARPSGLLAGSVMACIGSSVFLYFAKHYGYEYNFLLMTLLFVAGFVLGLLIEVMWRLLKRAPKV